MRFELRIEAASRGQWICEEVIGRAHVHCAIEGCLFMLLMVENLFLRLSTPPLRPLADEAAASSSELDMRTVLGRTRVLL